ncbi:MAG: sodium:calcium exchanger [Cyanobacteria bacterium QS_8_64_29]|nr:MAG: sodium:calcium exchanger [Cyanobacteria bacterium QS_8_64_29]
MEEDFRLIADIVLVLVAAGMGGTLAARLRQPALLGYLLGGTVVGPTGIGLIRELGQVETLAQMGVAFLLFALGVEFSLAELQRVRNIALGGGALQIGLMVAVTAGITVLAGWASSPAQGILLGAILSLSSTAVVLKTLMARNETDAPHGQVMLGILIVQDLALGVMLAVLPVIAPSGPALGAAIAKSLLSLAAFAGGAVAFGVWVIPRLLRLVAQTESRELFLLAVVSLCLSVALLTDYLGLSIEMGAFVAGLTISEVEYADQTLAYVEPLRDVFSALFFAAVGMLIDPVFLWQNAGLILGLVALAIAVKAAIGIPLVRGFGYSWRTAILTGLGLAQIGEFSFVLASEGLSLGLIERPVYLLVLGTSAVTLLVTPLVLQLVPKVLAGLKGIRWLQPYLREPNAPASSDGAPAGNPIVVCGCGSMGKILVRLLCKRGYPAIAIDQSEIAIQWLRERQLPYVYGNAVSIPVLEAAGVDRARSMAIALPDAMSARLCLKRSLELNPELDVVVRASTDRDIESLYQLGAREVVQPEFEASLELSAHVLQRMGVDSAEFGEEIRQIRATRYQSLRSEPADARVARELRATAQQMNGKWIAMPPDSPLAGMTLDAIDLRRLTGASIMAIQRAQGQEIDYPTAQTALHPQDRLLVVGQTKELEACQRLLAGETGLPQSEAPTCQWVALPAEGSALDEQALGELDLRRRYALHCQAIRRGNQFVRFPGGDARLRAGDRLLLCGDLQQLAQFQADWVAGPQPSPAAPSDPPSP